MAASRFRAAVSPRLRGSRTSRQFEQTTNERMLKCYAKGMEELLVTLRSDPSALVTQQRREPRIARARGAAARNTA